MPEKARRAAETDNMSGRRPEEGRKSLRLFMDRRRKEQDFPASFKKKR